MFFCLSKASSNKHVQVVSFFLLLKLHQKSISKRRHFLIIKSTSMRTSFFFSLKLRRKKYGKIRILRKDVNLLSIVITLQKMLQNDLDFRPIETTLKKYAEMTRKFDNIFYMNILMQCLFL